MLVQFHGIKNLTFYMGENPYLISRSRKSKTLKPLFACFDDCYYRTDQKL